MTPWSWINDVVWVRGDGEFGDAHVEAAGWRLVLNWQPWPHHWAAILRSAPWGEDGWLVRVMNNGARDMFDVSLRFESREYARRERKMREALRK